MINIDEARDRIGAGVVYQPYPDAPREDGEIVRVNDAWVFVLFTGDRNPKATRPDDLDWLAEESLVPKCSMCGRERTMWDAYDYSPLQVITGSPLGWYSGDDGQVCPQCMAKTLNGRL